MIIYLTAKFQPPAACSCTVLLPVRMYDIKENRHVLLRKPSFLDYIKVNDNSACCV